MNVALIHVEKDSNKPTYTAILSLDDQHHTTIIYIQEVDMAGQTYSLICNDDNLLGALHHNPRLLNKVYRAIIEHGDAIHPDLPVTIDNVADT